MNACNRLNTILCYLLTFLVSILCLLYASIVFAYMRLFANISNFNSVANQRNYEPKDCYNKRYGNIT